jgi:4-diphosphocytidyl-2-C-methyl-D-erythritol kinase
MNPPSLPTLPSPAKINLCLHITGQREDGYHNIQSAFQLVTLHDLLTFTVTQEPVISLSCSHPDLHNTLNDNLITKTAQMLQSISHCSLGVQIHLEKRIPMGAGMGGGSSNAATTLLALNHLWSLKLTQKKLYLLAKQMGADVPFFIYGHNAWIEGIGDIISPLTLPEKWFVVIKPNTSIKTSDIFSHPRLTRDSQTTTIASFLKEGGHNDFEPILKESYPEIVEMLSWLDQHGTARITGSGACGYISLSSQQEAEHIQQQIPEKWVSFLTKSSQDSLLHKVLSKK